MKRKSKKSKNILLYHGLSKDEYNLVINRIDNANRMMTNVFSGIATVFVAVMCALSFLLQSTAQNRIVYSIGLVASLFLFLLSFQYAKTHRWIIAPLVHISFSIYFLYGISIGTITNPTQQTVTFMVMLVFLPVLFIDRTIRVFFAVSAHVILFSFLCLKNKVDPVLSTDIMDAIIFGLLGIASGSVINNIKARNYVLEYQLNYASRFDQLTQMNNRNSFEMDLIKYPDICRNNLTCIYIDVNGLHELNNTQGHEAGDRMLKFIAKYVRETFGGEYTYRIGGDEFVAFIPDSDIEKIKADINNLTNIISEKSYHIAVGYETLSKNKLDMNNLIKRAEEKMYKDKALFYSTHENSSRRPRTSNI